MVAAAVVGHFDRDSRLWLLGHFRFALKADFRGWTGEMRQAGRVEVGWGAMIQALKLEP